MNLSFLNNFIIGMVCTLLHVITEIVQTFLNQSYAKLLLKGVEVRKVAKSPSGSLLMPSVF